jgi:hypothetical protein
VLASLSSARFESPIPICTNAPGLQHELRNTKGCRITAHLLIPGWTTTGKKEHKPGAWLPDQVIDVLLPALDRGDFYIICPDDETTPGSASCGRPAIWSRTVLRCRVGIPTMPANSRSSAHDPLAERRRPPA